ncbi:hypothetical protein [Vulcanisaeta distributa]|uniref:Uncharacterized protein n=1 Tax=Vulcanisaeta distributa (strain DSM 14429 / JCM 11212 / NBRC 100878 / IC-017) TaxID=572478 RepID=E1QSD6_VULDI|nr:hypothetical protein [Vulcanisaeta distributa]ADN49529.1 hypothetical protein Vdis_0116 [Vulcanisaeta distributa DSM 14429]
MRGSVVLLVIAIVSLAIVLLLIVPAQIVLGPLYKPVLKYHQYILQVSGPIIGALISVIAVLSNDLVKYYASTSTLRLSLGIGGEVDPGLDVEVFDPTRRISAMIINDGNAIIRDAKASLTIKVKKGNEEKYHLGDVLLHRNKFDEYIKKYNHIKEILESPNCQNYLANRVNPHVVGESLPWALPERIVVRPSIRLRSKVISKKKLTEKLLDAEKIEKSNEKSNKKSNSFLTNIVKEFLDILKDLPLPWFFTDYQHITSISPGQRNRLLIFDYVKLSDDKYLIMPYSEYGGGGPSDPSVRPYRACLILTKDIEFVFEITVHGEGSRRPLRFNLCITVNKLNQLESTVQCIIKGGDYNQLLKTLNNLKCQS